MIIHRLTKSSPLRLIAASLLWTSLQVPGHSASAAMTNGPASNPPPEILLYDKPVSLLAMLERPLTIAECLAEVCIYTAPDGTVAAIPSCFYTLFRWQTNAFFYREARSLQRLFSTNVEAGLKLMGRYGSNYWHLQEPQSIILATTDDASLNVRYHVEVAMWTHASKLYAFGAFGCLPGMLHFDTDVIKPFTNASGLRMFGEAHRSASGRVSDLALNVELQGRTISWLLEYSYQHSDKVPPELPSFVQASVLHPSHGKQPQYTVRYLNLVLSESVLPREYFDYSTVMQKGVIAVIVAKNKPMFQDPLTEKLRPVYDRSQKGYLRTAFMVFAIFLVTLTLARLLWSRRKNSTNA